MSSTWVQLASLVLVLGHVVNDVLFSRLLLLPCCFTIERANDIGLFVVPGRMNIASNVDGGLAVEQEWVTGVPMDDMHSDGLGQRHQNDEAVVELTFLHLSHVA